MIGVMWQVLESSEPKDKLKLNLKQGILQKSKKTLPGQLNACQGTD